MSEVIAGASFGISSDFMEATQVFEPSQKVRVYVEGHEDVPFWRNLFLEQSVDVEVVAYVFSADANGKGTIIRDIRNGTLDLGEFLIVALDSDYDYLMDLNNDIFSSEFVFQTYAYSIENLLWHPRRLDSICKTAACCDHLIADNDIWYSISSWSRKLYPDFIRFLKTNRTETSGLQEIIDSIKIEVSSNYSDLVIEPLNLEDELLVSLQNKGLTKDNIFLFVRGHNIEEVMQAICQNVVNKAFEVAKADYKDRFGDKSGQHISEFKKRQTQPRVLVKVGNIPCDTCMPKINNDINLYKDTYH
ncbi:DUF4435 domain-containing protein [Vibrio splendidus]|uniref:DUF4435 domain-containing protein n=1 Tax=Vibrio splendidus TaxID=29497 RepID=UPI000C81BB88|nr:DUF4435 domain-containing protein [Vibrio splendidus]PMH07406.1 hypothetical protein BCU75_16725 [Vibrio splendidus]